MVLYSPPDASGIHRPGRTWHTDGFPRLELRVHPRTSHTSCRPAGSVPTQRSQSLGGGVRSNRASILGQLKEKFNYG